MKDFLKKWWPTLLAMLGMVGAVVVPAAQDWIMAHPAYAAVVAGIYSVIAHNMKSPRQA